MSENLRVTLAYPYTGPDGTEHRADSTVSLPREEAKNLLHAGRARYPETPVKKAATPTKATKADAVKE
jgi:hypothetical protein